MAAGIPFATPPLAWLSPAPYPDQATSTIRRIELIGKHIGVNAFADRKEVSGVGGGPIKVKDELSQMEVARRIAWVLAKAAQEQPPL